MPLQVPFLCSSPPLYRNWPGRTICQKMWWLPEHGWYTLGEHGLVHFGRLLTTQTKGTHQPAAQTGIEGQIPFGQRNDGKEKRSRSHTTATAEPFSPTCFGFSSSPTIILPRCARQYPCLVHSSDSHNRYNRRSHPFLARSVLTRSSGSCKKIRCL